MVYARNKGKYFDLHSTYSYYGMLSHRARAQAPSASPFTVPTSA